MCGIAGVIQLGASPDSSKLDAALAMLDHRGPDSNGRWVSDGVALLHTRLSIIDLEGGDQPLRHPSRPVTLVANGEIYNYVELMDEFRRSGVEFNTGSDCESILHVYAQDAMAGINRLNGMFAFALFDADSKKMVIARDRLGIKPLYYTKRNDQFLFASELKAILAMLPQTPAIQEEALSDFLQIQSSTGRETIFEGIYRVLPGEYLVVDSESLSIETRQYWSPFDIKPVAYTFDEAIEKYEALFEQVMVEHMRSDVPYGLFLSGGIDSSSILAALDRWQSEPIRTFSIGFESTEIEDELDTANLLAKHFNTRHTAIKANRDDLFQRVVHSIWCADDLILDFAALPTSLLSETAAQELKVVFSGEGGDEAFGGYRRYADSTERKIKAMFLGTGGFRTASGWPGRLRNKMFRPPLAKVDSRRHYKEIWANTPPGWSSIQRKQTVDLLTYLPDILLVKGDRMMMGFGLEGRVPFCDHRMVEFGMSLPDDLKMSGKEGKQLVRKWGTRVLPKSILERPKTGFRVPVRGWISGQYLDQLEDKLLKHPAVREWFVTDELKGIFALQRSGKDYSRNIFSVLQFAIWHKLFCEGGLPVPSTDENPLDWL